MKPSITIRIVALAVALLPVSLLAEEKEEPNYGWSGKGEFGLVSTSGNSDTQSINLALEFIYDSEKWRHRLAAGAISAEDDGETTAKRYDFGAQTDYKLTQKSYVFGALRYENDDFSAYEDQTTLTFGYGRQLLDNKVHKLKIEGGVGYRTATLEETGEDENDAILRGVVNWTWKITPTTTLGERFLVESGSDNTYVQNDLGLNVAINSRFAVKLGFQVRHNTDVPEGVEETDTLTSANLVYNF